VCPLGNSVSVFSPGQQVIQPEGNSLDVSGDFSTFPGLGILRIALLPARRRRPQYQLLPGCPDRETSKSLRDVEGIASG